MKTFDLTGLSREQVLFLERLIALWKGQSSATRPSPPGKGLIRKEDLPPLPAWWQDTLERVRTSSFARLSEAEIGQLCEELAEEAAREAPAPTPAPR